MRFIELIHKAPPRTLFIYYERIYMNPSNLLLAVKAI